MTVPQPSATESVPDVNGAGGSPLALASSFAFALVMEVLMMNVSKWYKTKYPSSQA